MVARNWAEDFEGAMVAIEELFVKFGERDGIAAVAADLEDCYPRLYGRLDQARRAITGLLRRETR